MRNLYFLTYTLKIQHLEQLLESITETENKIQILNNWMEAQEERLKTLQKPGSVISVHRMLLDCQVRRHTVPVHTAWPGCSVAASAPRRRAGGCTFQGPLQTPRYWLHYAKEIIIIHGFYKITECNFLCVRSRRRYLQLLFLRLECGSSKKMLKGNFYFMFPSFLVIHPILLQLL